MPGFSVAPPRRYLGGVGMRVGDVRRALEADWPQLAAMLVKHDADPLSGGLPYLEMAEICRFLGDRGRSGDTTRFESFFVAVERCLLEGDQEAVELVVGLLEDLQNS